MKQNNGGPAFPGTYNARSDQGRGSVREFHDTGMTLRDYFAAQVLAGRFAIPGHVDVEYDAKLAYQMADAMLAARDA